VTAAKADSIEENFVKIIFVFIGNSNIIGLFYKYFDVFFGINL
jgi:hypothetical protein